MCKFYYYSDTVRPAHQGWRKEDGHWKDSLLFTVPKRGEQATPDRTAGPHRESQRWSGGRGSGGMGVARAFVLWFLQEGMGEAG